MSQTIGTTLDIPAPPAALSGELALRIRGGDYHGRVVRIRASQCTVGAAPDCTLRLTAPGLRPLHCIILRGEAGATVRRWSPDTQLNGRAFSDALLMPGDRLGIGPIELEVLDDANLSPPRRPDAGTGSATVPVAELAQEVVSQLRRDLRGGKTSRKSKVEKQRLRKSRLRIKSLEAELERLQSNVNQLAALDAPANAQPQIEAAAQELQAERDAWNAERQTLIGRLQEKESITRQLSLTIDDLRKAVDTHAAGQREQHEKSLQWHAERESLLCKVQEKEGLTLHLQSTLDQLHQSVQPQSSSADPQAEGGQWQAERQSLLSQLQEKDSFARHLQATVDELRTIIDQHHLASAVERQQLQDGLNAEQQQSQSRAAELAQLQARCDELTNAAAGYQHGEAAANIKVQELHDCVAALEAAVQQKVQEEIAASEAYQATQRQLYETFAECERLREELHQANCSLAAAQCRLTEQEAALTAFREMHQHAIAELELECKTLQSQLTDTQAKFDEQTGRLAELEGRPTMIAVADDGRIAELEGQLQTLSGQLSAARAAAEELRSAAEQSSQEWTQREQESLKRVECLERLAANLEDELRKATSQPDQVQLAEEQRLQVEQQLSVAQRQWSEQRQVLEDQALSAHQQMQEMENQVARMRDALHTAQGQVRERDQLLSQLRDEVRQQMAVWQQERAQLLQQTGAADNGDDQPLAVCWSEPPTFQSQSSVPPDAIDRAPTADRYGDRQMLAGCHALAEVEEMRDVCEMRHQADPPVQGNVSDALPCLERSAIWWQAEATPATDNPTELSSVTDEAQGTPSDAASVDAAVAPGEGSGAALASDDHATAQPADAAPGPSPGAAGQDEDESIEAYMARLLKRVRGDAVANAFVEQQAAAETTVNAASVSDAVDNMIEPAVAPLESGEFLPRKSAPELATDVAAMRELAVQSARQAINHSTKTRFLRKSLTTTLGACALTTLAIGLFAWAFDTGNWLAWSGCGTSLLGAGYLVHLRLKTRRILKPAS